jgi:hypothetical protein
MQLKVTNEDEGGDQQQGNTAINNGRGGGKGKGPRSERSESHDLHIWTVWTNNETNVCSMFNF